MSGNERAPQKKTDLRILRTRDRLGDALVGLMQEKPFDTIRVQEVLDRASVGRSTFYAHYRDKDDLFLSDVDEFWEAMATMLSRRGESSTRVAPVRELFAHVATAQRFYSALIESDRVSDVLDLGQAHFARAIEQRLTELPRGRGIAEERRAALAHGFAGALLALLSWWIDSGMRMTPAQMDDLFHSIVWSSARTC